MEQQQINTILEMYAKRCALKKIGQTVGMSPKTIQKWLKDNNYWTGHRSLPLYYDEFFFDKIDTEEKAYWLGFIYADGYLATNRNAIGIELKATDASHLEKFRDALQSEHEIKIYHKNSTFGPQDNARFTFSSKHMHTILLSYYKSPNKTFEGHFPIDFVPEPLQRHFIRGFFDGDGSISMGISTMKEGNLYKFQLSFIGQKKTLETIEKLSEFSWNWSQRFPERNTDNWQIQNGRVNECLTFLDYMYHDATVFLDRKYQRYQAIISNRETYKAKARV
nr:MAG TPA: endonuclease [Caudoviricetes sp.]